MKIICALILLCSSSVLLADTFDSLLESVKRQTRQELIQEDERVKKFVREKNNQQKLLKGAQAELATLKKQSKKLNGEIDANDKNLAKAELQLKRKTGDLGELFGVVRQVSGELSADFKRSMVSLQYPNRIGTLNKLSQSRTLPDVDALERLWFLMLQEMGETGKTRNFITEVVKTNGNVDKLPVTRVGNYALLSNGQYLRHAQETNAVHFLQRQPSARYTNTAQNFDSSNQTMAVLAIDPTFGQLFDLLTLKPTLTERISQGGVIGYIIIILGGLGLLIGLVRYAYLSIVSSKISRQIKQISTPNNNNPLGRIVLVYQNYESKPLNERELALEEAMIKEVPAIERYNGLIKLLAAVSPLLGLLGTVIGMIITFQSITLFGTSDPKLMAGGISTALVTTVLGLSMAIPLLFAHTFISSKSRKILDLIEHQSIGLITRN